MLRRLLSINTCLVFFVAVFPCTATASAADIELSDEQFAQLKTEAELGDPAFQLQLGDWYYENSNYEYAALWYPKIRAVCSVTTEQPGRNAGTISIYRGMTKLRFFSP